MMHASAKASVLCVDDEVGVLRSLRWLLQDEFDVETATGAREALSLLASRPFDVVISDQRMPDMTGTEFLAEAKLIQPRAMRLLLTGYSDYQAVLDSINQSEAYRFVNKPWDNSELLRIVSEAAAISRSLSSPPSAEQVPPQRDGTVLVLDQDPAVWPLVKSIVGATNHVLWAQTTAEAAAMLAQRPVAVMVCESFVAGSSTLPLLNALKVQSPEIVTMVLTSERDARTVRRLINEGQVFRFVMKPAAAAHLAAMLHRAIAMHWELVNDPPLQLRYGVDPLQDSGIGALDDSWSPYAVRVRRRYAGEHQGS